MCYFKLPESRIRRSPWHGCECCLCVLPTPSYWQLSALQSHPHALPFPEPDGKTDFPPAHLPPQSAHSACRRWADCSTGHGDFLESITCTTAPRCPHRFPLRMVVLLPEAHNPPAEIGTAHLFKYCLCHNWTSLFGLWFYCISGIFILRMCRFWFYIFEHKKSTVPGFLLRRCLFVCIRANTSQQNRLWNNRYSANACL